MKMHRTLLQKQLARTTGVTRYITEKTLERLGIAAQPLRELKAESLPCTGERRKSRFKPNGLQCGAVAS